ncbi:MAG: YgiQ family radical SAM protein [Bacteroidales bacterium]|nr:YgiQ family radical SAM protein [Bacteroidales bacterium]
MPHFLPITLEEVKRLGWESVDVVLVSGDAYVDHPSFGTAVIGRTLEAAGYRVAIIPQPNWRDDLRDFRKFGRPRLFFGVTSGAMDSMVNHYTAARRLRHDDAYTPGGQAGFRPDRATYVYTRILKQIYPDVPVVIAGIEASMRRLAHYDYWDDKLFPSILIDTPADLLNYGMGERTTLKIARLIESGKWRDESGELCEEVRGLPQVAYSLTPDPSPIGEGSGCPLHTIPLSNRRGTGGEAVEVRLLHSFEECQRSKRCEAENYQIIERESNKIECATLIQKHGDRYVVVNPPEPPMTTEEIDASFDLPYMRLPHPKYKKRGTIPAFEMIRWSVNTHRGCFGGCSFCTISAHQGKQIASRSEASILREVELITQDPDFHGVLTDLGGPSANMWRMKGKNQELCKKCARYSCSMPTMCKNLDSDHRPMINLLRKVASHPKVKHLYVGSGIRCDLFSLTPSPSPIGEGSRMQGVTAPLSNRRGVGGESDNHGWDYFREVVLHHTSGRLKVAPEHTSDHVLAMMRKPSFELFRETKRRFDEICREAGLRYQLIPYFISSHPGCRLEDMADLALKMKQMGYRLEQIQDFTPTPMTLSTEMYYTGIDPTTMRPVYVATTPGDKADQRRLFFFYKPEMRGEIVRSLRRAGLEKYIAKLYPGKG